jgi:hypothetical protein
MPHICVQRVSRGSGWRLVPYSSRFMLTEPHRRHAARGPGAGRRLVPYSSRFTLTEPHRRHAAWQHSRRGRGGGGAGGGGSTDGEGGRNVKGDRDFKF